MSAEGLDLWRSADATRWFLFAEGEALPPGDLPIAAFDGREASVDPRWATLHEVGEAEGREWAREALGYALGELRQRIDARLARARAELDEARHAPIDGAGGATADAVPAMVALARSLPRTLVDSLSADPARVAGAAAAMAALGERLNRAGIGIDRRLADFPYQLSALRSEFAARGGGGGGGGDDGA
jgi:hypothetical protein